MQGNAAASIRTHHHISRNEREAFSLFYQIRRPLPLVRTCLFAHWLILVCVFWPVVQHPPFPPVLLPQYGTPVRRHSTCIRPAPPSLPFAPLLPLSLQRMSFEFHGTALTAACPCPIFLPRGRTGRAKPVFPPYLTPCHPPPPAPACSKCSPAGHPGARRPLPPPPPRPPRRPPPPPPARAAGPTAGTTTPSLPSRPTPAVWYASAKA